MSTLQYDSPTIYNNKGTEIKVDIHYDDFTRSFHVFELNPGQLISQVSADYGLEWWPTDNLDFIIVNRLKSKDKSFVSYTTQFEKDLDHALNYRYHIVLSKVWALPFRIFIYTKNLGDFKVFEYEEYKSQTKEFYPNDLNSSIFYKPYINRLQN
ncbi:hypothetical protein PDN45_13000 [Bacillus cereus]|nr:hypothetical protein [Bacillus cereus]